MNLFRVGNFSEPKRCCCCCCCCGCCFWRICGSGHSRIPLCQCAAAIAKLHYFACSWRDFERRQQQHHHRQTRTRRTEKSSSTHKNTLRIFAQKSLVRAVAGSAVKQHNSSLVVVVSLLLTNLAPKICLPSPAHICRQQAANRPNMRFKSGGRHGHKKQRKRCWRRRTRTHDWQEVGASDPRTSSSRCCCPCRLLLLALPSSKSSTNDGGYEEK